MFAIHRIDPDEIWRLHDGRQMKEAQMHSTQTKARKVTTPVSGLANQLAQIDAVSSDDAGASARSGATSPNSHNSMFRDGAHKRAERTRVVLAALKALWNEQVGAAGGIGLAAVGSLARGQFGPHSDLDLALLYDDSKVSSEAVKRVADELWYPLWDTGISLDHSVRSVRECISVTNSDIAAAVGWLSVKPVVGDMQLVTSTAEQIADRWRKAAHKRIPGLDGSVKERAKEFGVLAYMGQPNLKESRGGLRDATLVDAIAASWLADKPHGVFDAAVEKLLDVRDCLQLVAGKETSTLATAYQPGVAALLGLVDPTLPKDQCDQNASDDLQVLVARLGRRIAYSLDATLSRAVHSLMQTKPRFQHLPGRLGAYFSARHSAPVLTSVAQGISEHEGQIVLDNRADVVHDHALTLRVGAAAATRGMRIAPITVSSLAQCPVDDSSWNEESRSLFTQLLGTGPALIPVWEELDMAHVPSRLIPEWDAVRNRPADPGVHRFTVDRHMVEVASRLTRSGNPVSSGEGYDQETFNELLLAGIFHDIGKRRGVKNHCAEGARQVTAILYRMGYGAPTIARVALLVREHLTLSDYALHRDPTDRGVWQELSDVFGGDPVLLDMLFDLTAADSSSLGATANEQLTKKIGWSPWRQRLVTQMYHATRAWMVR